MKNLIKDTIFIIIFLILPQICSNILIMKGNGYGSDVISFYNQKKNTLDILFLGSSHSYASFSPDIIKKEINMDSYNFATQQQPIYITYYYLVEALKYQKPKYVVLETHMLVVDWEYAEEGTTRDAIDKMRPSINKINAINTSVKDNKDRVSYYLNIIKYHSRYSELQKDDIKIGLTRKGLNNKGFKYLESKPEIMINNKETLKINEKQEIYSKNLKYLEKIIELCNDKDIELILISSPCELNENMQKKYNWLKEYASNNNLVYINYNEKLEELELKSGDFYDTGHLSGLGAEKITINFASWLKENKNL